MHDNTLAAGEIKRRGMAASEESLQHGPVRLVKRNKPTAVVLSEAPYQRLLGQQPPAAPQVTALPWLLGQRSEGKRSRADIDAEWRTQRAW